MTALTLSSWLLVTSGLFSIGLYGALTRRNAIGILLSIELMLNAGALNFLVFGRYAAGSAALEGALMTLFLIAIAAADAVVALAIFVAIFRNARSVDVTRMAQLRG